MPETAPGRGKIILVYALTAAGAAAWLAGIFLAPLLRSRGAPWAGLLYAVYAPVCHQLPARSYRAWGHPLGVCVRCLGIYLGFAAGTALYPAVRGFRRVRLPAATVFIALSGPIAIDTVGVFLRVWDSPAPARLAVGFLWGAILPFYLITGFAQVHFRRRTMPLN